MSLNTLYSLIIFFLITGFNGQPCMTLQMKFFRLVSIDSSGQSISSPKDVAVEIDAYTYQLGKLGPSRNMFVSAQEVVFDSLGKVTCNHSMYVDTVGVVSYDVHFFLSPYTYTHPTFFHPLYTNLINY